MIFIRNITLLASTLLMTAVVSLAQAPAVDGNKKAIGRDNKPQVVDNDAATAKAPDVTADPSSTPATDGDNKAIEGEILPYYQNYLKEYRLGPSDQISIEVFGQCPDYCKKGITIPPNARISYPLIRDGILVAGRTVEEIAAEITKQLNEYIIDPKVTVTAENAFEKIATDAWRSAFDLNLVGGALLPCQEFGPVMAKRGKGSIINIASVSAHLPLSRVVAYSAAKAAVLSLTQFLAREWAKQGVRVNSITPGFFPAEQNRALLYNPDGSPTARAQQILGHTPMGRFGDAQELIGAAVFLASSKASSFVTGSDLRVDGGFLSQTI